MKTTDLNYSDYWNNELNQYNKKLIPLFINLSIAGLLMSIFVDYLSIPKLFAEFAVLRIVLAAFGFVLLFFFKKEKINGLTTETTFILAVYLFFAYGASIIEAPRALLIWNTSVALAAVFWPVFILIRHHKNCITTNLILAAIYMTFLEINGNFPPLEVFELGGSFIVFSMLVSPFIAFSRYQIYSDNAFLKHQLESYATFDSLTGLINRRVGITYLEKEMQLSQRHHYALTIIYIDVDLLKNVNDTLGHEYGDELIITIANQLKSAIRKSDVACRMGGDEFLLILHECDYESAKLVMKNIENSFESINNEGHNIYRISVSYGIAEYPSIEGMTFHEFIKIADDAMYQNKNEKLLYPSQLE